MERVILSAISCAMLILISAPLPAHNSSVSMQQLRQCREYSDNGKRLACYDRIGDPAPVAETPTTPADTESTVDTVGSAEGPREVDRDLEHSEPADDFGFPKSEDALETNRATVVRCGESNNRKFYFYFDNGQAWQYLGGKRLRYTSCNSPATLREDSFGFTLQIDGKPSLRVQRVR